MLRIGSILFLVLLSPFLGCGDKDLPDYPYAQGGAQAQGGTTSIGGQSSDGSVTDDTGAGGSTSTSAPTAPVYTGDMDGFLTKYCNSCHAGSIPPRLDSYANAKTNGSASNSTLQKKTMPPSGLPMPSEAEKARFDAWVKAGMPQ